MKEKDKFCLECNEPIERVIDKHYGKLDYYFCNNTDCKRCGLLTVIFNSQK